MSVCRTRGAIEYTACADIGEHGCSEARAARRKEAQVV